MAQKQISEMTTEELNKNLKLMRIAIAVISASIGVMIVSAIVSYSKKGFSVFTILPLMFIPILTMNIANMKKIKTELQSRK
ncbi:MAG: redox-active disulfide protein 2 [Chitinophagaceae bacterium]|nr:redox-active disulfide protein 2 [Chitinophagaceae bacterium]